MPVILSPLRLRVRGRRGHGDWGHCAVFTETPLVIRIYPTNLRPILIDGAKLCAPVEMFTGVTVPAFGCAQVHDHWINEVDVPKNVPLFACVVHPAVLASPPGVVIGFEVCWAPGEVKPLAAGPCAAVRGGQVASQHKRPL